MLKTKKNYIYDEERIKSELTRLQCSLVRHPIQILAYVGRRVLTHLFSGLYIDQRGIDRVKRSLQERLVKIIYVPLNRSIADLILHNFINIAHNIDFGFTFASVDDTPDVAIFLQYVKMAGVILAKQSG